MTVTEKEMHLKQIGERFGSLRLVNPRAERQMRDSLKQHGQMSPIVIWRQADESYELLDGFKRLHASAKLGHLKLRARVLEVSTRVAKAAILSLNWASSAVSDLEEGWVVRALYRDDGLTQAEVGLLLGKDRSWVSRRLSLVERLCDEVQSQLRLGLISTTIGRELARVPRGTQEQVLKTINEHALTSREVAGLVGILNEVSDKEQALQDPRKALVSNGIVKTTARDPRLCEAGQHLLQNLTRMEQASAQVVSSLSLRGLSKLRDGSLFALAPILGRAKRASRQASQAIEETLDQAQEGQNEAVQQS